MDIYNNLSIKYNNGAGIKLEKGAVASIKANIIGNNTLQVCK